MDWKITSIRGRLPLLAGPLERDSTVLRIEHILRYLNQDTFMVILTLVYVVNSKTSLKNDIKDKIKNVSGWL